MKTKNLKLFENVAELGMGIVYILLMPILLIDTGTYRYCYRYCLVQKDMRKVVKHFKLFYNCWTLASALKFFSQEQWVIFLFVFYFINIKRIVHP